MNMRRRFAVFVLASMLVSTAAPLGALAGTRSLWPDHFTPSGDTSRVAAAFDFLGATSGVAQYDGEVRLPVGTRITRFRVNADSILSGYMRAHLRRKRLGEPSEGVATVELTAGMPVDWYEAPSINPSYARVAAGYRYWVELVIPSGAHVFGVQVSYR